MDTKLIIENYSHEDFIGIYDTNFETKPLIEYFHWAVQCKVSVERGNSETMRPNTRRDTLVPLNFFTDRMDVSYTLDRNINSNYIRAYNEVINSCMDLYATEYEHVAFFTLQCPYVNVQRTLPKQGYHTWHCENAGDHVTRRVLATMIYLNDDFEAGETEFLYQSKRIQPKPGRVVIWPAGFTHVHRGNPPHTGEKYIATSWLSNTEL